MEKRCVEVLKRYQLFLTDDGILLSVEQAVNLPYPSDVMHLAKELAERKITCQPQIWQKCFAEATGEKVKLANVNDSMFFGPLLDLKLGADLMFAVLRFYPALDKSDFSKEKLYNFLQSKGVKHGIKQELFSEIIGTRDFCREWIIAEGTKEQKGQDASLHFLIQIRNGGVKPRELEDGNVDFFNLDLIQIVEANTVLVEKIPPTPGIRGINVLGQEVEAPFGKDIRLPVGLNTIVGNQNTTLISTTQGHVNYHNGKLNIYPFLEVKKDVDFNTGNIKFPGDVIIKGNVRHMFVVEAGGDVEILGNLEGTVLTEGNLKVNKGILRGRADAKGSISVRYIENSQISCGEDLLVTEAILYSEIKVGKRLVVSGNKGLIAGGKTSVGQEIIAKNVGAPMGTETILEVGVLPELWDEYKLLHQRVKKLRKEIEENRKNYNLLSSIKEKFGNLPQNKNELFGQIRNRQIQIETEFDEAIARISELEGLFEAMEHAKIRVRQTVYIGCVITIGKFTLFINEEQERVEFRIDDFEVRGFNI